MGPAGNLWVRGQTALFVREKGSITFRKFALAEGARNGTPIPIALADLDFFKSVNDRFGHQASDAVLILLAGCGKEDALRIIEQVRSAVCETPFELPGQNLCVTCSFGVAELTTGQESLAELIETADRALYGAKRDGRNRVEWGTVQAAT